LNFLHKYLENISVFVKIRPVGAELLHAGGRTDRPSEANSFLNFANAPKNQSALFREVIALCSESHPKHTNTLDGQEVEFVFTAEISGR
jgi:hypothetical protein